MPDHWKAVECPRCAQPPGRRCRTATGNPTYAHAARHTRGDNYYRYLYDTTTEMALKGHITVHLPGDQHG